MLAEYERLKHKLEPQEAQSFIRRIISLNSNIVYWTKQLETNQIEGQSLNRLEAQVEIKRCNMLLSIVAKDLKKVEARN
jgi:hypothetical protein